MAEFFTPRLPSYPSIISRMALLQKKKELSSTGCLSCLIIPVEQKMIIKTVITIFAQIQLQIYKGNKDINKRHNIRGKERFRQTLGSNARTYVHQSV